MGLEEALGSEAGALAATSVSRDRSTLGAVLSRRAAGFTAPGAERPAEVLRLWTAMATIGRAIPARFVVMFDRSARTRI